MARRSRISTKSTGTTVGSICAGWLPSRCGTSGINACLLARDRMGQKPLYYYHDRDVFVFGSEIKALLAHPAVPRHSSFAADGSNALTQYLSYGTMPAPNTAFQNIFMLPPATWLQVDVTGERQEQSYWELPKNCGHPMPGPGLPTTSSQPVTNWKKRSSCV